MRLTWKQRLFGTVDPTVVTTHRTVGTYNGMTLDAWKQSNEHIGYIRDLHNTPKFRDLLAVLSNSRPQASLRPGITDTEAAILYGIRLGYDQLLGTLLDLATYPPVQQADVPIDYGADAWDVNRTQ
jgi:hypothetical protein